MLASSWHRLQVRDSTVVYCSEHRQGLLWEVFSLCSRLHETLGLTLTPRSSKHNLSIQVRLGECEQNVCMRVYLLEGCSILKDSPEGFLLGNAAAVPGTILVLCEFVSRQNKPQATTAKQSWYGKRVRVSLNCLIQPVETSPRTCGTLNASLLLLLFFFFFFSFSAARSTRDRAPLVKLPFASSEKTRRGGRRASSRNRNRGSPIMSCVASCDKPPKGGQRGKKWL